MTFRGKGANFPPPSLHLNVELYRASLSMVFPWSVTSPSVTGRRTRKQTKANSCKQHAIRSSIIFPDMIYVPMTNTCKGLMMLKKNQTNKQTNKQKKKHHNPFKYTMKISRGIGIVRRSVPFLAISGARVLGLGAYWKRLNITWLAGPRGHTHHSQTLVRGAGSKRLLLKVLTLIRG